MFSENTSDGTVTASLLPSELKSLLTTTSNKSIPMSPRLSGYLQGVSAPLEEKVASTMISNSAGMADAVNKIKETLQKPPVH